MIQIFDVTTSTIHIIMRTFNHNNLVAESIVVVAKK